MTVRVSAVAATLARAGTASKSAVTWQTKCVAERNDATSIARDLTDCRQRGLDWLDHTTKYQAPVPATALQQLAADYVAARGLVATERIDQIKLLLRHGIEHYLQQGHVAEATLVRDLFFGGSMDGAIPQPSVLLKSANTFQEPEARFRQRRAQTMQSFAKFLIGFVASTNPEPVPRVDLPDLHDNNYDIYKTRYADDSERFVHLLATASKVTIVGFTNERLLPLLREALSRKRANGRTEVFWDSLRIVFLGNDLLAGVNDEREDINDPVEQLRQRSQASFWAYKSIGAFLKRTRSARWALYKCPYIPALTGSLFEFDDHKKIVHVVIRRARKPFAENVYIELEDHAEQFSVVFEDIVKYSANNYNVPVGTPAGAVFQCRQRRLHSSVLKDGSRAHGWLPMVLVVMTRRRDRRIEPILQFRTQENSARELNRLSHLGGHILQEDCEQPGDQQATGRWFFGLTDQIPVRAAARLVAEIAAIDPAGALRPRATGSYLYPDKENLFFFIFSLELQEGAQFPRQAEMHAFPLPELLSIRANQVLRSAADLCRAPVASSRIWRAAAGIVALNLSLHGHDDLGGVLVGLADQPVAARSRVAGQISDLVAEQATPGWALGDNEFRLTGLAGWQYREFFRVLLPLYARINVDGAVDLDREMRADRAKSAAIDHLHELYQNEDLISQMPIEL